MNESFSLPLVSIITPSYNQARFIEEAIESVLAQDYPCVEHIVVDGGSTDGTLDILHRYDARIRWVSEPDRGQSDALNKGFRLAQGEFIGWVNSDDRYEPGAVAAAVRYFAENPAAGMVYGDCHTIDEMGCRRDTIRPGSFDYGRVLLGNYLAQPAVYFRRSLLERAGYLDETLHYVMDYDLWLKLGLLTTVGYIPVPLASFREYGDSKTGSQPERFWPEIFRVYDRLFASASLPGDLQVLASRAYGRAHWRAGITLVESGDVGDGCQHCRRAVEDFGLLEQDAEVARQRLVRNFDTWRLRHPRVVGRVLVAISPLSQNARQFAREIWPHHLAEWFYTAHESGDVNGVLYAAPRLAHAWPRLLLNRGFVSISARACLGVVGSWRRHV